ncbi:lysophospholipid acyltransferase family protein [Conexibacter sp. W3-3-2]|uniref:lysophospholipid acyltransferase family protein n=1 Tax=Conexibacter sp. W3-3-2 TaxID=2675227 RepID=UPI002814C709|nr:lysophospholipid acyltransferase family protein [Conexibacter sp. W3-3-2]
MLLRLFSYAYWAVIGITCPIFFVGAVLVWLVTLPFDRRKVVLHMYSCAWALFYVTLNPIWRLDVRGREHLPWRGPAVIVANHASLIDILVLFGLLRPFKWVSKAENFKIPFVGWNMTLNGYVPLVRGDRASVIDMLATCSRLLQRGNPVLFFPEGTRSKDGRLRPFKDGAFELAIQHGVPLIPVAVDGTAQALPKHGMVLEEHVRATVQILEPMDPADYADVAALREAARERIATALGQH